MNYSTNYNLNKPERNEQFNLDHWNENTDAIDTAMNTNKTNIANNASNISTILTGLSTINTSDTNSVYYKLMKLIYPVGSIYWSSRSTNPGTLFGGNWVQIKDRFVLACGDTYNTTGTTGGASTVTLSVSNMPSHNHTFTPSGNISMDNHNHTFTPSGTISVNENPTFTGTEGTTSSNGDHTHTYMIASNRSRKSAGTGNKIWEYEEYVNTSSNGAHTHTYTSSGTISGGSYTFTGTEGTTSSTTSTGSFTGTQGTTDSNGSGTAFDILPPYVVKYCWERTA